MPDYAAEMAYVPMTTMSFFRFDRLIVMSDAVMSGAQSKLMTTSFSYSVHIEHLFEKASADYHSLYCLLCWLSS
jgi:hypothetical protein